MRKIEMNIDKTVINKSVFKNFYSENARPNVQFRQINPSKDVSKKVDIPVAVTTIAGILLSMLVIRKYQDNGVAFNTLIDKDFLSKTKAVLKSFNLHYGLKEMVLTSFGSIFGGLAGGLLFDKNENKKAKIKESVFQFSNILIPTSLVAGLLKLADKRKIRNSALLKITPVLLGIGAGMPIAAAVSNKINSSIVDKSNKNKRKIELKDCFVHIDDILGALVLAKIPFADKLHVDKILPILYGICGYEVGSKK